VAATAEVDAARQAQEAAASALTVAATTLDLARRAHAERAGAIQADLDAARTRSAEHAAFVARLPESWRPALDQAAIEIVLARLDAALDRLDGIEAERDLARQAAADGHARVNAADGLLSREVAVPCSRLVGDANRRAAALREVVAAIEPAPGLAVPDDLVDVDGSDLDASAQLARSARDHTACAPLVLAAAARAEAELVSGHDTASAELAQALGAVDVSDVEALHAALGRAESELAMATTAVAAAAAAAGEAAHIDAVRAVLDPFVANLKVLAIALRDQHFVAHLVRARETELLAEATRRLKDITGGRFGFTAGFGVVSIASGEVRTPDTLSGGERFQAALALALGLVEIASRGGGKLDAVFVDEGFGSLDSTALDTALETLGKVAGGGKMVALISHLRPVAEYVDTVLHVTRDDVLGSRIEVLDSEAREQLLSDDIRARLTT
jgi:exonuclease SbcC